MIQNVMKGSRYEAPDMLCVVVMAEQGFAISEYGVEGEAGAPLDDIDNGVF